MKIKADHTRRLRNLRDARRLAGYAFAEAVVRLCYNVRGVAERQGYRTALYRIRGLESAIKRETGNRR